MTMQQRRAPDRGPKGRALDDVALAEVRELLGQRERRRDLLIEFLHLIQDRYGCLSAAHLRALAEDMRLSQVEVYEVATFYDHFDVVREGEARPAPLTIRVCESISCMLAGAEDLIGELAAKADSKTVRVMRAPCMGRCATAPAARVGDREVDQASSHILIDLARSGDTKVVVPDYVGLDAYRAAGGYQLLRKVKAGETGIDAIIDTMQNAGLRGLGGAGFPAGKKWNFVRGYPGPRLMSINGDEGEPGTFKDRIYLEKDPHRTFEGALIAAHAVEAERIYFYMRDEYPAVLAILRAEIAALEAAGIVRPGFIELRRGAGAYICGEESAMLESIEGKRGMPRHRPPYIAEVGLFGRPTLNHNVETLWWIRDIVEKGPEWFAAQGKPGHQGIRSWSVSGHVKEPGVKLAPAGVTVRELIEDYCGGMADGHEFKAYLPGGASGGILPASMGDIELDFGGELAEQGAFVGSHAVVVLSQADNIRDVTLNLMNFFKHESCGKCTPCREGTEKLVTLLKEKGVPNETAMRDLETVMRDSSICGLGQAAPNPVNHLLTHFRDDL
ncbi:MULTISPECIES: NADH-ubiquinone oxidoreductase-F iron-sulfur binding region domain-containing protein [unclassified Mesorhizobium]|uniref:NAD(P)H-dependent oxidoreductase subunit E n=1 Tax=unclassified Mesorhizobium TaxID=325217 RepID=UPI000FE7EE82|nr:MULTISPECIES: NADH-ubiquinone oxidoreductase-F iron-sulfur binding region domain-containing protein [unclassified Mesorhizobium]RWI23991.1 MAG: NADH-quinone oxidoreductase subunit F [Mesorhizobium sp.]RWK51486.1 MAG: NADH-quinone oxidoreductase subunit F [Mesorhizobium sp.]RWK96204.1 MAG: NADH-quinone oxidoreductase subunit F [Mesorhizobium sp.]TIQ22016.1 MAG: NADH-quinone oxidoreductase subunit F [Mesorhizobium sp.]TIQ32621.1 MAG: NADH-quinone oxidoreductase subunit F [Mesorhizobium sp.]